MTRRRGKAQDLFADTRRGADTASIVRAAGLDAASLDSERTRIPLAVVDRLRRAIAGTLDDPFLGLHFGEACGKHGGGHFLFAIMNNSETLLKALQSLIRYHGLMTHIVKPALSVADGNARLTLDYRLEHASVTCHLQDAALSLPATVLRGITKDEIRFGN